MATGIDDLIARRISTQVNDHIIGTIVISKLAFQNGFFSSRDTYFSFIDKLSKDLYFSKELIHWVKNS